MIRAILAVDSLGGIGRNNTLPWPNNKADLQHFKDITKGHTVVMGRGTWESDGMPHPLPGRKNIVVTSNPDYDASGATILSQDVSQVLTELGKHNTVFIIGGVGLIMSCLDIINVFHLTRISGSYGCDTVLDMSKIYDRFERIDSVEIDRMTKFETYLARRLYDFSIPTKV